MTDFFDALTGRFGSPTAGPGVCDDFRDAEDVSAAARYRADVATIDEQLSKNYVSMAPATEGRLQ